MQDTIKPGDRVAFHVDIRDGYHFPMIVREVIGNLAVLQNIAYGITGHTSVPLHQLVKIP